MIEKLSEEEKVEATLPESAFAGEGVTEKSEEIGIDPKKHKWKAFLAGPSGSGKTTTIATLPGKKLLVDFDNRAQTVAGMKDVEVFSIHEADPRSPQAWNRAVRLKDVITAEVRRGIFPYDVVFFDGLTMMGRVSLNWSLLLDPGRGLGGAPAQQHYLPQMDNLSKYVLATLALPIHVVYTGHIELFEDKASGAHKFYPKITGKLRSEVANWFNETYYCYRTPDENGVVKYYWQTAGSGRQEFFKSSLNTLGNYWKDPILIDFDKPGPVGFGDLYERRFGKKKGKGKEKEEG